MAERVGGFATNAGHEATVEAFALAVAADLPVLLWGDPGSGKTSATRGMTAEYRLALGLTEEEYPLEVVIASVHEPADFGGLPAVVGDGVKLLAPEWAQRLAAAKRGVLFLDEISTAPPAVQAAVLRVVLERTVGSLVLPPAVVIVAAANPPEQLDGGWDLSAPLANRFVHLDWSPDATTIIQGMLSGFPAPRPPLLDKGWFGRHAMRATAQVTGFLHMRPGMVSSVPTDATTASRGWPSPRSWEVAIRVLAACAATKASDSARNKLLIGAVGEGPAIELVTYIDEMDLPDPEKLLADPGSFVFPDRGDQQFAVLAAVATAVVNNPTPERWTVAWDVLAVADDAGCPDVAVMAACMIAKVKPAGTPAPPAVKRFSRILRLAGIID